MIPFSDEELQEPVEKCIEKIRPLSHWTAVI